MINLLIINSTLQRSGVTNVIYNLCKFLDKRKVNITIITLSKEPSDSRITDFESIGVKVVCFNKSRLSGIVVGYQQSFKNFLLNSPQDVVHTFSYRGTALASKYLRQIKRVVTLEANLKDNYIDSYGKVLGSYIAEKELAGFKTADCKVVCSQTLFKHYHYLAPDLVVQNGADETIFYPVSETEKIAFRIKNSLPLDKKIYISVGSLIPRKDPNTIFNAYLLAKLPNSILLFLGSGPLNMNNNGNDNVIFKGNVLNVDEYLKCADVFVSASHSEGLPNTVLEAALSGLTCIVSDIPQHHDVFYHSEANGVCFFPVKGENKLAQLLTDVFPNKVKYDCQTATNMAQQYLNCYTNLLN